MQFITPKVLVVLWIVGSVDAFFVQTIFQRWVARATIWGYAPGWQREIAFWNIGLITILAASVKFDMEIYMLPGLVVLSFLLGTNHLAAFVGGSSRQGHGWGMLGNYLFVLLTLLNLDWIRLVFVK